MAMRPWIFYNVCSNAEFGHYHCAMKTTYILGTILACSVIGTLVGGRGVKTVSLVFSGALAAYGLVRILG